jgi:hypothetical protein
MTPHVKLNVQMPADCSARVFPFLTNFPFFISGSASASDEANNFDGYHAGIRGLLFFQRTYPTLPFTSWCLSSVYARGSMRCSALPT